MSRHRSDTSVALEFRGATVGYGSREVVSGADLTIARGEFVGLVGPNGAGKSTMLRAVTTQADLLGGEILIEGDPRLRQESLRRAATVAVVPQSIVAAFAFTAREFVEMGRHPHIGRFGRLGPADHEIVSRALEQTDTGRLADVAVDRLSGGDVQRLLLAQALAQEPRILLLDEPTSHLDLNHRLQVLDLVADLAHQGTAILAVFHDLDIAARYSDRIAVVAGGSARAADVPERVLTSDVLREVFGVRAVVGADPVTGTVIVTPVMREAASGGVRRGRVLLVAGSGTGAAHMRRLALAGWEVTVAALNAGDVDLGVAQALDLERVELAPYAAVDDSARAAVVSLAEKADACVVCEVPFGGGNVANLEAVVESGRPLVLLGDIEGRDFAHGAATELWNRALEGGALSARGDGELLDVLAALRGI